MVRTEKGHSVCCCCSPPAALAVFGRMQLTLHATRSIPHGASRLVQEMSARSLKSRRAPSRHCSDTRVYGHTTTAMHNIGTSPSPTQSAVWQHQKASWPTSRHGTALPPPPHVAIVWSLLALVVAPPNCFEHTTHTADVRRPFPYNEK